MTNYDKYVKEINNIFSCLEKLKKDFKNNENLSYIEEINKYRDNIIKCASIIEKKDDKKVL